jgi:hypothetical protein
MRERAAVRPAGPAPTISTVVLSGRDIILRRQKDKMKTTVSDVRKAFMLVFDGTGRYTGDKSASIMMDLVPGAISGTKNGILQDP